jgi:hypothetical protein
VEEAEVEETPEEEVAREPSPPVAPVKGKGKGNAKAKEKAAPVARTATRAGGRRKAN